jgi:hypothetical protein
MGTPFWACVVVNPSLSQVEFLIPDWILLANLAGRGNYNGGKRSGRREKGKK